MGAPYHSSVALLEADRSLLLEVRPNLPGRLRCPGMVSLFGGGINPGESPDDAMIRELSEELATPRGTARDLAFLKQVWEGEVAPGYVHLFVAQLACQAEEVDVHPNLRATGTGILVIPFDQYPIQSTTVFALRALTAHSTGDYQYL